mmetsp:Transcript_49362/g.128769  ORF Transcript_49362/g.128769 Transcript_49362/m.128769 type:complete len:110 (-) Transcript_49362:402-731(-)
MTIVEVNTIFLVLRRHVHHSLIDLGFNVSWIAIRVLWFPFLAVYFALFVRSWPAGWQGTVRHMLVAGTTGALAVLQLQWTRNALQKPAAGEEREDESVGEGDMKKKGFL